MGGKGFRWLIISLNFQFQIDNIVTTEKSFYNNKKIQIQMSLSASKMKQGGMTTLELQAQNIVKDDDSDDVQVTDEAKYNALVESRKNRRAVSNNYKKQFR